MNPRFSDAADPPDDDLVAGRVAPSRRGRDLLAAIRRDALGDERDIEDPDDSPVPPDDAPSAQAMQVAFCLPADDDDDAEPAAFALARRLATSGRPTALLSLDPLGGTLWLIHAGDAPAPDQTRPQSRAGNRGDWNDLLARLAGRADMLLVTDSTGQLHRLLANDTDPPAAVVLASADSSTRLAAYRRLKQLDADGAGQLGLFFTDLDPRARAAFNRLAATADQFLGRRVCWMGCDESPDDAEDSAEMVGQRPSTGRQENRADLTRWLSQFAEPLDLDRSAADEPAAEKVSDTFFAPAAVLPIDHWPRDDHELGHWLAERLGAIDDELGLLDFRPPPDRSILLAARPGGELVMIRPIADAARSGLSALAGLLAARRWANDHWPLLAGTWPELADAPAVELVLIGINLDRSAAGLADIAPVRTINLLPADLSSTGQPGHGLMVQELGQL